MMMITLQQQAENIFVLLRTHDSQLTTLLRTPNSKLSTKNSLLIAILCIFTYGSSYAQIETNKKWHLQKPDDKYVGVAATTEMCTASPQKVIVAVIDGGTDPSHPDLKENIWVNEKEVPGNGIDDDKNGYVDDISGWNFLGGKSGNVDHETLELTRLYRLPKSMMPEGIKYKEIKRAYKKEKRSADRSARQLFAIRDSFRVMLQKLGTDNPKPDQVEAYVMQGRLNNAIKNSLVYSMRKGTSYNGFMKLINDASDQVESELNYHLNTEYNPRTIIGDDISNDKESGYGNNDVKGGEAAHGTHVAGIIGAVKNNELGGDGVAAAVKLMIVRVVPDGDERDKDVANGIRYAVDNGAKVINMSFGKDYSPDRAIVEEAIKYAASKDVLFIHGSGNDSRDNDLGYNYPTPFLLSTNSKADNWIEVGSSNKDGSASDFSNYGVKSVDVFAPGMNIYSTLPDSAYGFLSGTSMASPVVAGVACLIRSCYPQLTAVQVKEAIMKSAEKRDELTPLPGSRKKLVPFFTLSVSGGIINAERAMAIASGMAAN